MPADGFQTTVNSGFPFRSSLSLGVVLIFSQANNAQENICGDFPKAQKQVHLSGKSTIFPEEEGIVFSLFVLHQGESLVWAVSWGWNLGSQYPAPELYPHTCLCVLTSLLDLSRVKNLTRNNIKLEFTYLFFFWVLEMKPRAWTLLDARPVLCD